MFVCICVCACICACAYLSACVSVCVSYSLSFTIPNLCLQEKLKRCLVAGTPLSQAPTSPSSGVGSATNSGSGVGGGGVHTFHHSATLTPGTTRRHLANQQQLMAAAAAAAAEPSIEQQRQYGFAKLASALYLKDVDQDGFLEVDESLSGAWLGCS